MDTKLRTLARLAETDPDARVEWLTQRVRLGTLTPKMLELAGYCGDAAARRLLNEDCSCGIGSDPWEHADRDQGRCRDKHFMTWVRGFEYWGNGLGANGRPVSYIHDEMIIDMSWVRPGSSPDLQLENILLRGREVILRAVLASAETAYKYYKTNALRPHAAIDAVESYIEEFRNYVERPSVINDIRVRSSRFGVPTLPAFDFHRVLGDITNGWLEVIDAGSTITDVRPAISETLIKYALGDADTEGTS
jgi:hypothetical protein